MAVDVSGYPSSSMPKVCNQYRWASSQLIWPQFFSFQSLKKNLTELEKDCEEAEKKWIEIQKQEKVRELFDDELFIRPVDNFIKLFFCGGEFQKSRFPLMLWNVFSDGFIVFLT